MKFISLNTLLYYQRRH